MKTRFILLPLLLVVPFYSQADQSTSTLLSTSTVDRVCNISANPLQFGIYNAVGAQENQDLQSQSTIQLQCTRGSTSVVVALDQGLNPSENSNCIDPARRMKAGEGYLNYAIYSRNTDSGSTRVWGCDTQAVDLGPFNSSLEPLTLNTYGTIPKQQNAPQGTYVDTVGVVVFF